MDKEAIVVSIEGDHAHVEISGRGAGCGRCHEAGGCESSILGQLFSSKSRLFRIANPIGAVPGEHVIVRVADGATLRASILIYALPVFFLLLGAAGGGALGDAENNDAATVLGALAGLSVGVLSGLTLRKARIGRVASPILLRRIAACRISKEAFQ